MSTDSHQPTDNQIDVDSRPVSILKLVVAILVMLIPASIPLYFAFGTEGTTLVLLIALGCAIAVMNTLLVFGIWSWLNAQSPTS